MCNKMRNDNLTISITHLHESSTCYIVYGPKFEDKVHMLAPWSSFTIKFLQFDLDLAQAWSHARAH